MDGEGGGCKEPQIRERHMCMFSFMELCLFLSLSFHSQPAGMEGVQAEGTFRSIEVPGVPFRLASFRLLPNDLFLRSQAGG